MDNVLYRRDSSGEPCFWSCNKKDANTVEIKHGKIIGKSIVTTFTVDRDIDKEIKSRIAAKFKSGYKFINELKDNCELPRREDIHALYAFLNTYLPYNRTTSDGILLPMLAKTFNDNVFKRCSSYIGQYKINGLRCFISVIKNNSLFKPFSLRFQSREGTIWNSLTDLEDYLLTYIPQSVLLNFYENNIIMDGEVYLPGYSVNQINHFVKDNTCIENKALQYWCYDLAIEETIQCDRKDILYNTLGNYYNIFISKEQHLNNKDRLIILPNFDVTNYEQALKLRNNFVDIGFEGLILRNPTAEYEFGKRKAGVMIKYKKSTDGIFTVIDIVPESGVRKDIPLLICRNDINDATFECHLKCDLSYQKHVLINKNDFINKQVYVEYGERSGVNNVPFHIKDVRFI